MRGKGIIAIAVAVFLFFGALFVFAAGTYESVPPGTIALHYTGGPIQGTHYVEVVQPGTGAKFYGLAENLYKLPATQRNYIFSRGSADGDKAGVDFITAPSKDQVQFTFEAAVYFKLNTNPEVLQQFFEQICLHDNCWTSKGWDQMLDQYFRPQVENSLRLEAGKYDRAHLYSDPATLSAIQTDVANALKDRINTALGGAFFCGPDSTSTTCSDFEVTIKNPTPPDNVAEAYAATAASEQLVIKAQNDAAGVVAKANGDRDAQNARAQGQALTPDQIAYLEAVAMGDCAKNSSCTLVITDTGTGINVNTK